MIAIPEAGTFNLLRTEHNSCHHPNFTLFSVLLGQAHNSTHNEGGYSITVVARRDMHVRGVSKNKEVKFLFSTRVIMDTCGRRTSTHNGWSGGNIE